MAGGDDHTHDHVVIPLPANFAVLIREALNTWRAQLESQALFQRATLPPRGAEAYRNGEIALFDQIVTLLTSTGRDADAVACATVAVEQRRRLFPPPPDPAP